ncbi:unnamed protein product [Paramecium pentaurelia]|uniref:Uncharacterized protein n=1 Tax=Paramecium pentaurelia TaxID=43138 RepID=A0A8S1WZ91_9CILI|nr:unnamed protein product [Paramecium pentaurelia]
MQQREKLFIICGNINYSTNLMPFMKEVIIQKNNRIKGSQESKTDFILVYYNAQVHLNVYVTCKIDHFIFEWQKFNYQITSITNSTNSKKYLFIFFNSIVNEKRFLNRQHKLQKELVNTITDHQILLYKILNNKSEVINRKKVFESINRILIMKPSKKEDSDIMNCFIDCELLISCNKYILQNCLQQIAIFQQIQKNSQLKLFKLNPISPEECQLMKQRLSQNKGLNFYLIYDKWIKQDQTYECFPIYDLKRMQIQFQTLAKIANSIKLSIPKHSRNRLIQTNNNQMSNYEMTRAQIPTQNSNNSVKITSLKNNWFRLRCWNQTVYLNSQLIRKILVKQIREQLYFQSAQNCTDLSILFN